MKELCHHQTLAGLPKHFPKKLNQSQCKIFYTANMKTFPKGKTVDTTNLQQVELVHVDLYFYNVTSICGFTSILTVVCAKTIII